jgi:hypothetical protein
MDLTDDPLAGVDASELEADIDKAIDELFVKKGEAREPSLAKPEEPAKKPVEEPKDEPAEEPAPAEPNGFGSSPIPARGKGISRTYFHSVFARSHTRS